MSLGKNSFVLGVVSLFLLCHGSHIVVLRLFESHEHIVVILRIDAKCCTSQCVIVININFVCPNSGWLSKCTLIGCLHEWLVDVEDPSIVVPAKKQSRTHVVDNRSLTAMKASDGARAGIIFRSDTFGCDHWGVLDMLQHGQILLLHMKAYL